MAKEEKKKKAILVNQNDFALFQSEPFLDLGTKKVSLNLIKELLNNPSYYDNLKEFLNGKILLIKIALIDDEKKHFLLRKENVIASLELALKENLLNKEEVEKYQEIRNKANYASYKLDMLDKIYMTKIDHNSFFVDLKDIFNVLEYDEHSFQEFLLDESSYKGIPKDQFLYICYTFYTQEKIYYKWNVPINIMNNIKAIINSKNNDIHYFNKFLTTIDFNSDAQINEELKNYILDNIPEEYNLLEKIIYIYLKLCLTLTYDPEFYALNEEGVVALKHGDINNLKKITKDNNKVVCYEFNAILAYFLRYFHVNYEMSSPEYANHSFLTFRYDKFIVSADAVKSMFRGDLTNIKLGKDITGLDLQSLCLKTKEQFWSMAVKVYSQIKGEYSSFGYINEYQNNYASLSNLSVKDRLDILIKKLNLPNLSGIDNYAYLFTLKKLIFLDSENIDVTILCSKENLSMDKEGIALCVITINPVSIDNMESNKYYIYNPNGNLIPTSLDELKEKFKTGLFNYIPSSTSRIPGIEGELSYDR